MNFTDYALRRYGKTIAEFFLLNYSEKLWGMHPDDLSAHISGGRMRGLDLATFLREAVNGVNVKATHLDGAFYYPRRGFGTIVEELARSCGEEGIRKNARITRIFHDRGKIEAVEINGKERKGVDQVISTLPLPSLIKLMVPLPSEEVLSLAAGLQFRNLIVVVIFISKDSITENGSIYFPESEFSFTRIYEPKNRSGYMSPSGQTSLCAEIPCSPTDELWNMEDARLFKDVSSQILKLRWMRREDILDFKVIRMQCAYPILEKGYEMKRRGVIHYAKSLGNLHLSGRNGKFKYTHMHDMMRFGRDTIGRCISDCKRD